MIVDALRRRLGLRKSWILLGIVALHIGRISQADELDPPTFRIQPCLDPLVSEEAGEDVALAIDRASEPLTAEFVVQLDSLWIEQEQESFLSGTIGESPPDEPRLPRLEPGDPRYEAGFRLVASLQRPSDAWEICYFGPHHWSETKVVTDGGAILSPFTASGHGAANVFTSLARSSNFHNLELDYQYTGVRDGLDVTTGLRYVYFDERLDFLTRSVEEDDLSLVGTRNNIFAAQAGMRRSWDLGLLSVTAAGEGGFGVNFLAGWLQHTVWGHGMPRDDLSDNFDTSFTTYLDIQVMLSREISRACTVRCGYQGMVVHGLALTGDLLDRNRTMLDQGQRYAAMVLPYQGSVILHGFWLGLEIRR